MAAHANNHDNKNTIRDGGSTALYAAYTVDTVYTVDSVDMVTLLTLFKRLTLLALTV